MNMKLFENLEARGLIKQTTNTEKLRQLLNDGEVTFYIGFDPTAESLHVGHLLQIVTARRLIDAGHNCILLIGGATAMIGDPTGKSEMRRMLTSTELTNNCSAIEAQIQKLINWPGAFETVNNISWFQGMGFLEMLRTVGPHFSVNNMLRAECFKSRMEHGLSFMEFNYMILQAFDFFVLWKDKQCLLQVGGDDQWSNMLAGIDLIHKKTGKEAFALTIPLLVNSDGTKMGKTEKGAVWLDKNKTSVWDFFQFWRNIPDSEVDKCIAQLTFLPPIKVAGTSPAVINSAKKALAFAITSMVHGEEEAFAAQQKAESLFENKDSSSIEAVEIKDGTPLLEILVQHGFAKSRTDARNLIGNRGITINDHVVETPIMVINRFEFGEEVTIRKGKKTFGRFTIKEHNEQT